MILLCRDGMTNNMKKADTHERIVFIDILKSIACLCVLIGHVINGLIKDGLAVPDFLRALNSYVYLFHVPCFFFASGYLYANTRVEAWSDYLRFIFKKLIVLGLPYVVCSVAYILFSSVMSADMHTAYSFEALLSLGVSPVAQYWYLYALFEIFLIVPVVEFLFRRIDKKWILLGFVVCALLLQSDIVCIDYVMAYTCFFYLGTYFNHKGVLEKECIRGKNAAGLFLTCCAVSLGIYLLYHYISGTGSLIPEISYAIKELVRLLLVIGVAVSSVAIADMDGVARKFLLWLSQFSLYIYLFHTWFTGTLRVLLRKMGVTDCWVQTVCGIVFGLAGTLVMTAVIKKVMFFRFWFEPYHVLDTYKRRHEDGE